MFIKAQLYDQLWDSLTNQKSIQSSLEAFKPTVPGQVDNLHTHSLQSLHSQHGNTVCLRMMVQDIYEPEYYSAAVVKPGKIDTREDLEQNVIVNKYWVNVDTVQDLDHDEVEHVILDREMYRATTPKGETQWLKEANGGGNIEQVILKCDHKMGFKLGQIVYLVGVVDFEKTEMPELIERNTELKDLGHYYPVGEVPRINVIGTLSEEDIEKHGLDYKRRLLKEEINLSQTKEKLLQLFQRFCSVRYSQFLLYSLINTQRMGLYISGENLESLIKELVPYFVRVSITLPIKEEFFPKKDDVMRDSSLQLSDENTYVILDFTNMGEGKLEGDEIFKLQNLKKFAEDGEIPFTWEMGESIINKNTSGIIARASSIIEPTFTLKNESISLEKVPPVTEYSESLQEFRAFIVQVRSKSEDVVLSSDEQKTLIEADYVNERQETEGKLSPQTFSRRLLLCRLQGASEGSKEITHKMYQRIKELTK